MRGDQLIGLYRMRLLAMVVSAPSIREGCRRVGIHHSTYYDWVRRLERDGVEGLIARPGRRRAVSPARIRLEAQIVALALANPPWGPRRLFYELKMAGIDGGSVSLVWRVLKAHRLNTTVLRYRLLAIHRGLTEADMTVGTRTPSSRPVGELHAEKPGDLVQFDCFHIGALKEARIGTAKKPGVVWQYTAIDVASSFVWAELHTTIHNPSPIHTSALAHRVAVDLTRWGWHWTAAVTDNGNEFKANRFTNTLTSLGVDHRRIRAGRPQTNGKVEQVQNTILRECWQPSFVSYVEPSVGGLRRDLDEYLDIYNHHRPHHGKWNQGQTPAAIIIPNTGNMP